MKYAFHAVSLLLFFLLPVLPSEAALFIHRGIYDIPAFIVASPSGPEALFNLRTFSRFKLILKGKVAQSVSAQEGIAREIKIRLESDLSGFVGTAELLSISELKPDQKVPALVGNDFRPISQQGVYK